MTPVWRWPLYSFKQLHALETPLGLRDLYNSVSYCNRCGSCMQACPIYQLTHQEAFSPRGRNQLLRLILEQKLKPAPTDPVLLDVITSCTLCGRCTQACAGQIPTAEHVLEMRRAFSLRVLPGFLQSFLQLRTTHSRIFALCARSALLLRRMGFVSCLRTLRVTRLSALRGLIHINEILPARITSLKKTLSRAGQPLTQDNPELIYLPSLEAEFILPDIALRTLQRARQKHRTVVWKNTPTGLFDYVYGDLRLSRRTLRRLITKHAHYANGNLPLVTDSIDVYLFLKRAPQLFAAYDNWQTKARRFAACVRFVTDLPNTTPPVNKKENIGPVLLDKSALFERQGGPFEQAQKNLYTFFGKNLVECFYTDADVPAFGYVFVDPKKATQIGLKAVEKVARTQTRLVVVLSGLAALELTYLLKKFYPAAKATHFVHVDR